MMLWYKMWRESRIRFAIGAAGLLWMCGAVVALQRQVRDHAEGTMTYSHYIWSAVYKANVLDLFVLMVIVLGLGGVVQEREQGTAGFTLSLPIGRWRLVATRAATGLVQVGILALLPALLIPLLSPFVGEAFPLSRALQFSVLWTGGGTLVFALAFFFSVVLPGAYSPAIASLAGLLAYSALVDLPWFKHYPALDLFEIMHGAQLSTTQGEASLPLLSLALYALMAFSLVCAAGAIVARRDL
jgi:ABC-2 type transport system permease protein